MHQADLSEASYATRSKLGENRQSAATPQVSRGPRKWGFPDPYPARKAPECRWRRQTRRSPVAFMALQILLGKMQPGSGYAVRPCENIFKGDADNQFAQS